MQQHPDPPAGAALSAGLDSSSGENPRVRFLKRIELFRRISPQVLDHLAQALAPLVVPAGFIICREGEPADRFYMIESGTVAVTAAGDGKGAQLARLGPGEFFGEISLLSGGPRTATVTAVADARFWCLSARGFEALLALEPELDTAIRRIARRREAGDTRGAYDVERLNLATLVQERGEVSIGRSADNDVVFSSPLVSRRHAVVERSGDGFRLRDLRSSNGSYVNGTEVTAVELKDGDEIWIGDERLVFDRRELQRMFEPRGVRIDITDLTRELKDGKRILDGVTLSILPGEFVAVVGGSGAGKTTLMDAISGVRPATSGSVRYNGRDYYRNLGLYRNSLGYVPQDDIIHAELPLRRTLQYAARLRLPGDMSRADREAAVDDALRVLNLTAQSNLRVSSLSGGQRKRASIGVELLTRPRVFFLDEPTSGLDPATDRQMMEQLRRLADDGSTVVLTTHATKNIAHCDKIIVLARGGLLAFAGTPDEALGYFSVASFDEVYDRLGDELTPEEWAQRFHETGLYRQVVAGQPEVEAGEAGQPRALGAGGGRSHALRQWWVLLTRNLDVLATNARDMAIVLIQPIVIALLTLTVIRVHAFHLDVVNPRTPLVLVFILVSTAIFYGVSNSIREIVKEYSIFRRERMVNLSIGSYVLSKAAVIAPILILEEVLFVLVLILGQRLPDRGLAVYGPLIVNLWLNAFAAMAMGLFVSASSTSSDQASRLVPIMLIPQLLFSGALFSVPSMSTAGQWISRLMQSKWALDSVGHILDLNGIFKHGRSLLAPAVLKDYGDTFGASIALGWVVLVGICIGFLALTYLALRRKSIAD